MVRSCFGTLRLPPQRVALLLCMATGPSGSGSDDAWAGASVAEREESPESSQGSQWDLAMAAPVLSPDSSDCEWAQAAGPEPAGQMDADMGARQEDVDSDEVFVRSIPPPAKKRRGRPRKNPAAAPYAGNSDAAQGLPQCHAETMPPEHRQPFLGNSACGDVSVADGAWLRLRRFLLVAEPHPLSTPMEAASANALSEGAVGEE